MPKRLAYLARASRYAPKSSFPAEAAYACRALAADCALTGHFPRPHRPVNSAVFSPDGRRVLTASGDKTARLWEAESGKLLATFQGHTGSVSERGLQPGRPARAHRIGGQDRAALGG